MFELLLFCKRKINFGDIDFYYSVLTYVAILVATTFSNLFDISVIKILVIASFLILHFSIRY